MNNSLHLYGVKRFQSLRSEFHSILTPVEWKFSTQRVKSRPVHSIFTPKEVITDVTTQGVKNRVNRVIFFLGEYKALEHFRMWCASHLINWNKVRGREATHRRSWTDRDRLRVPAWAECQEQHTASWGMHAAVTPSIKGLVTLRVTIRYGGLRQVIASERTSNVRHSCDH